MRESRTVVFSALRGFALTSSRLPIIKHFLSCGWQVIAAVSPDVHLQTLSALGVTVEQISFQRGGVALFRDLKAFGQLLRVYRNYNPSLIHLFHAKPIILGNLAAYFTLPCPVVSSMTGLGNAFIQGGITRHLATLAYRSVLTRSQAVIFQNPDDRQLFIKQHWTTPEQTHLIIGSGVDIEQFSPPSPPNNRKDLQVLMVARLLWQKGVREFVEAADIVRTKHPHVKFRLGGEWDMEHLDSIEPAWIHKAVEKKHIQFIGYVNNMPAELKRTAIFVLPSYREGVPRVLLEAAATGIPAVTSDTPGCREAVVDGETGYLVPVRDSRQLAEAIIRLVEDHVVRREMGRQARLRAEAKFDIRSITRQHLSLYTELGIDVGTIESDE